MIVWWKNNAINIFITIVTIILGTGAFFASMRLQKLALTETETTQSADAREVCRAVFTLQFKPTPRIVKPLPTIAATSAFSAESAPSATGAAAPDLASPAATAVPTTTLLNFELSPTYPTDKKTSK